MVISVASTGGGAGRSTGSSGCVRGFGWRRRIWRSRGGVGACRGSAASTFEVCGIPTRAFELKTSCSQLLGVRRFTARGAVTQGWIGHFLQLVFSEAASAAFISINWHR